IVEKLFIGVLWGEVAQGIDLRVNLKESVADGLPLQAHGVISKRRGQRVCAVVNFIQTGSEFTVFFAYERHLRAGLGNLSGLAAAIRAHAHATVKSNARAADPGSNEHAGVVTARVVIAILGQGRSIGGFIRAGKQTSGNVIVLYPEFDRV